MHFNSCPQAGLTVSNRQDTTVQPLFEYSYCEMRSCPCPLSLLLARRLGGLRTAHVCRDGFFGCARLGVFEFVTVTAARTNGSGRNGNWGKGTVT